MLSCIWAQGCICGVEVMLILFALHSLVCICIVGDEEFIQFVLWVSLMRSLSNFLIFGT